MTRRTTTRASKSIPMLDSAHVTARMCLLGTAKKSPLTKVSRSKA